MPGVESGSVGEALDICARTVPRLGTRTDKTTDCELPAEIVPTGTVTVWPLIVNPVVTVGCQPVGSSACTFTFVALAPPRLLTTRLKLITWFVVAAKLLAIIDKLRSALLASVGG